MAPPNFNASASQPSTMKNSPQNDFVTNTVFGLCAVIASLITIWQGHRAWKAWHKRSPPSNEGVEENARSAYELTSRLPPPLRNNGTFDDTASASPSLDTNATLTNGRNTSRESSRARHRPAMVADTAMVNNRDGSCAAYIPDRNHLPQQESDFEQNTQAEM